MIQVEYIGLKPLKTDNVAGTATVWHGPGDVQAVKPEVWAKLKPFDTVWREAAGNGQAVDHLRTATLADAIKTLPAHERPEYVLEYGEGDDTQTIVLDSMDESALREFIAKHGLTVDSRIKKLESLRAAVFKAATASEATEG